MALSGLSVGVLKRLARENGVSLVGCLEKGEIVAALAKAGVQAPTAAAAAPTPTAAPTTTTQPAPSATAKQRARLETFGHKDLVEICKRVRVAIPLTASSEGNPLAKPMLIRLILEAKGGAAQAMLYTAKKKAPPPPPPAPKPVEELKPAKEESHLSACSVSELRGFAAQMKIDVSGCLEKGEIVAALEAKGRENVTNQDELAASGERDPKTAEELREEENERRSRFVDEMRARKRKRKEKEQEEKARRRQRGASPAMSSSSEEVREGREGREDAKRRKCSTGVTPAMQQALAGLSVWRVKELIATLGVRIPPDATPDAVITEISAAADDAQIKSLVSTQPDSPATEGTESDTPSEADEVVRTERDHLALSHSEYTQAVQANPAMATYNRPGQTQVSTVHPCGNVSRYKQLYLISEGAYGRVWKAFDREERRYKALKQFKMDHEREGIPSSVMREVEKLQMMRHENVVRMDCVVTGDTAGALFFVMEYADYDMCALRDHVAHKWTPAQARVIVHDVFAGLAHLHLYSIVHRDIKPANILYTRERTMKLCDFGCARSIGREHSAQLTPQLVTLWYRAPEILIEDAYGLPSDVWSAGVLAYEVLMNAPFAHGKGEVNQIKLIVAALGEPAESASAVLKQMCAKGGMPKRGTELHRTAGLETDAVAFLDSVLKFCPRERTSASDTLQHQYIQPLNDTETRHQARSCMPTFPPSDAHMTASRRAKRREHIAEIRKTRVQNKASLAFLKL